MNYSSVELFLNKKHWDQYMTQGVKYWNQWVSTIEFMFEHSKMFKLSVLFVQ